MTGPSARDLDFRFADPPRPCDLTREALLRVREHSKLLFGNQDRLEVAVAISGTALNGVNATDLHEELNVAVNRIRAQLLALEKLGYLRKAGVQHGKHVFQRLSDGQDFWGFALAEYRRCIKPDGERAS